jgi:hypothetical protein
MVWSGPLQSVSQNVVDRMLDAVQAGACREHPAREDPLHLALQGDLVDLDKGVGVGSFRRRPGVAGIGLHAQRAELHGLADILVEIDDASVILSRPEKLAFLLVILVEGGSCTTSSPGCNVAGACGGTAPCCVPCGVPLGCRCPGGRPGNGLATAGPPGLRRLHRNAGLGAGRRDGRAGRRRQGLRLHAAGRRHALRRWQRPVRRRQQAAARQFRHFLVVVVGGAT